MPTSELMHLVFHVIILLLSRPLQEKSEEVGLQSNLGTCGVSQGGTPPYSLFLDSKQLVGLDFSIWLPSRPGKLSSLFNP